MDTWATSSLTPQIAAARRTGRRAWTGSTRWTCGRRPTRSSGPGCSTRCCARHLTSSGVLPVAARGDLRLDPGPGPEEDVQVPGQRGHPDGLAAQARLATRCATGRPAAASAPTWSSTRPSCGWAAGWPSRYSTPAVRAVPRRRTRRRWCRTAGAGRERLTVITEPLDRAMLGPAGGRGGRRARPRSRTTTTPGRCSEPRRSSGSSATTTWSWSSPAPTASTAPRAAGLGRRGAAHRAVGAAPAVRAGPAVRHRGGVVVVAGRVDPPGRLAGPGRAAARWPAGATPGRWPRRRPPSRAVRGAKSAARLSMRAPVRKLVVSAAEEGPGPDPRGAQRRAGGGQGGPGDARPVSLPGAGPSRDAVSWPSVPWAARLAMRSSWKETLNPGPSGAAHITPASSSLSGGR